MGGGYSDNFTGTAGAIGERASYQYTVLDELPVRIKKKDVGVVAPGGGGIVSVTRMKRCFCCGEYTIPAGTENEICPICEWIDDEFQNMHPNSLNGKNPICLNDAKETYNQRNASDD